MTFVDIRQETKSKINDLFEKGYTPSLAHKDFIRETKTICDNEADFHVALSDRSIMPSRNDFNQLYRLFNEKKYGTRKMDSIFEHLKGIFFLEHFSTF